MNKKLLLPLLGISAAALLVACASSGKLNFINRQAKIPKIHNIVYFNPEIYPNLEEIKLPSYATFFDATTNQLNTYGDYRIIRVDNPLDYDSVDTASIKEYCQNNNSQIAVVPKIKYFKVGFGNLVFSNQVLVSLKLYDAEGNYIMETSYDTYKGNGRLLGATENSVKIGTEGAIKRAIKELRAQNASVFKELKHN